MPRDQRPELRGTLDHRLSQQVGDQGRWRGRPARQVLDEKRRGERARAEERRRPPVEGQTRQCDQRSALGDDDELGTFFGAALGEPFAQELAGRRAGPFARLAVMASAVKLREPTLEEKGAQEVRGVCGFRSRKRWTSPSRRNSARAARASNPAALRWCAEINRAWASPHRGLPSTRATTWGTGSKQKAESSGSTAVLASPARVSSGSWWSRVSKSRRGEAVAEPGLDVLPRLFLRARGQLLRERVGLGAVRTGRRLGGGGGARRAPGAARRPSGASTAPSRTRRSRMASRRTAVRPVTSASSSRSVSRRSAKGQTPPRGPDGGPGRRIPARASVSRASSVHRRDLPARLQARRLHLRADASALGVRRLPALAAPRAHRWPGNVRGRMPGCRASARMRGRSRQRCKLCGSSRPRTSSVNRVLTRFRQRRARDGTGEIAVRGAKGQKRADQQVDGDGWIAALHLRDARTGSNAAALRVPSGSGSASGGGAAGFPPAAAAVPRTGRFRPRPPS